MYRSHKVKTQAGESGVKFRWKMYAWYVPVVSYFSAKFSDCASGALEYDIWPRVWNTIERMTLTYSGSKRYVVEPNGHKHWELGYYRTQAMPTSEGIMAHIPYQRANERVGIPPHRTSGSFVSVPINGRNCFRITHAWTQR